MSDTYKQFELGGDDSHLKTVGKRWSGVKGQTDRFSFINFPGLADGKPDFTKNPVLVSAPTHYFEGAGYVISAGPEFIKQAGEAPRQRAATLIVQWPADKDGTVFKTELKRAEVKVLILAGVKYDQLVQTHRNFPLGSHDVTALCTDTAWQKVNFSPCAENLLVALMKNPKGAALVERLIAEAQTMLPGLSDEVGHKMTFAQLREKLAGGDGRASVAGSAAASETDIDEAMDDLLGEGGDDTDLTGE